MEEYILAGILNLSIENILSVSEEIVSKMN